MKQKWKERYNSGGICDFRKNYDFYFRWLLNKVCECFYIKNLPETIDEWYLKTNLILDGDICITDFNNKLYTCIGAPAGPPDEYYVPVQYTIANPVLGSKVVDIGKTGIVIYNTSTDKFYGSTFASGLYELINQTATILADNIISINCNQINSRASVIFTADSDAQAIAGEIALKKIYTGSPYQVLRSDLIDKITVNPVSTANISQNLTELIELHNYIISQFFQSIGIKSDNLHKKSHVLQDEIDVQNDYLQISILEILTSWQKGFDAVNALYGTDIHVELNPVLIPELVEETTDEPINNNNINDNTEDDTEDDIENNNIEDDNIDNNIENEEMNIKEEIEQNNTQVEEMIDMINDNEGGETDDTEPSDSEHMGMDDSRE